ncbi:MAG: two-component system response regulator [Planctomycetota bacterium]|nr:MAG: two-component system response regulator [Planctomycetota bacterium]
MSKNTKVLIVDDNLLNLEIVKGILEEEYSLEFAKTGTEAIEKLKVFKPDIVLQDIMLPDIDGFDVLAFIKNTPFLKNTKVIMVSALMGVEMRLKGYEMGAHDYIVKPFEDDELKAKIDIFSELVHSHEIKEAFNYTIEALSRAAEACDEETGNHIVRVNEYSYTLAKDSGQDEDFCNEIRCFAQMHDVGKIHVPMSILNKKGSLSKEEFVEIKGHPIYGAKIIGESEQLRMAKEIALYHHEKWDGSGYPSGISGKEIPLSGRIVAITDVYDALRSERSYKPAFDHKKTMTIFKDGDDRLDPEKHFDPELLSSFLSNNEKYESIFESLEGEGV